MNSVVDLPRGATRDALGIFSQRWIIGAPCGSGVRSLRKYSMPSDGASSDQGGWSDFALADDLPQVFRADDRQAGDDGDDQHQLDGMQQPRKHYEQEPDDDEGDNDLHGARLPSPLIQRDISQRGADAATVMAFRRGGQWSSAGSGPDRPTAHASAARYRPGVTPVSRRKIDVRWLWSANPAR
jgi:hypothetical protein